MKWAKEQSDRAFKKMHFQTFAIDISNAFFPTRKEAKRTSV